MRRKSKKQVRKLFDGRCFFCGLADYDLLDAHRIFEGKDGGTYAWENTLTTCSLCHRKLHCGKIKILGNHRGMTGWHIHFIDEDGLEKWRAR